MKKFLCIIAIIGCTFIAKAQETTTYYLIRHAEKDRTDATNRNPNLNAKGMKRAKKWAQVFQNVDFDLIYSTNYNRTQQTAIPTAKNKALQVLSYDPRNMYDKVFQENTKGKTVLVVGHSNTTPFFANKILGKNKYQQIDDRNNANLYIVTISGNTKKGILLHID